MTILEKVEQKKGGGDYIAHLNWNFNKIHKILQFSLDLLILIYSVE